MASAVTADLIVLGLFLWEYFKEHLYRLGCEHVNTHCVFFFHRYLKQKRVPPRCRFWHTCLYIFSAQDVKPLDQGHPRSGHQVMPSDLTSEKVS